MGISCIHTRRRTYTFEGLISQILYQNHPLNNKNCVPRTYGVIYPRYLGYINVKIFTEMCFFLNVQRELTILLFKTFYLHCDAQWTQYIKHWRWWCFNILVFAFETYRYTILHWTLPKTMLLFYCCTYNNNIVTRLWKFNLTFLVVDEEIFRPLDPPIMCLYAYYYVHLGDIYYFVYLKITQRLAEYLCISVW